MAEHINTNTDANPPKKAMFANLHQKCGVPDIGYKGGFWVTRKCITRFILYA